MKKLMTVLFSLAACSGGALAQSGCASSSNIYSFTANGINYEVVKEMKTWANAAACAVQRGGHLVHIDSQAEQTAVYNGVVASGVSSSYVTVNDGGGAAYIWIGATDKYTEGTWVWDGDDNNSGTNFWTGQGLAGAANGAAVANSFVNWGYNGASIYEPDDFMSNQDGGAMALSNWPFGSPGMWNDIIITNSLYFVIEYPVASGIAPAGQGTAGILLFPNPASEKLSVNAGNAFAGNPYFIYDLLGNQVMSGSLDAEITEISIGELPAGMYYLCIAGTEKKKFTVVE